MKYSLLLLVLITLFSCTKTITQKEYIISDSTQSIKLPAANINNYGVSFTSNKDVMFGDPAHGKNMIFVSLTDASIGRKTTLVSKCIDGGESFTFTGQNVAFYVKSGTSILSAEGTTLQENKSGTAYITLEYIGNNNVILDFRVN